ncbi:PREDICTED: heavy metal-associated isoprenylated plant protein 19-like [Ipomoea nil]|uniref:heavy metal-associated isoprenylated plant protein 19-like n=1 Tax=Ipomoea nil TaxID=35883 RepID=UPI000901AA89|nr:PREDICTED: heavy metal-associated isoprenylated plant protein 19-like [Ipomoea nil]
MHCNACERRVAKTISKIQGVEKLMTDMNGNKVVVIGHMDPSKVLKKLKKKTRKRVEMVVAPPENEEAAEKDDAAGIEAAAAAAVNGSSVEPAPEMILEYAGESLVLRQCSGDSAVYTMFSDENPNACSIM